LKRLRLSGPFLVVILNWSVERPGRCEGLRGAMKLNQVFLAVLAILLVLVITGCNSGAKSTPSAPISAVLSPDKSVSRINEFQNKGNLSLMGATFLALTKLEFTSSDKNLYNFGATFPTNTKADITLRMTPNQKYTPTAEELSANQGGQILNAGLTYGMTGTTLNLKLAYFLPQGALSASIDSLKPAVSPLLVTKSAVPLQYLPVVYRDTSPRYDARIFADGAGEQNGTTIDFVVALTEAGKEFVSAAEEVLMQEGFGLKGNPLSTTASSALDVVEALNTSAEYQDLVGQLDELQAQAENPTNALTEKAYAQDPGLKERIMNEIADVRTELKCDAAAQYLNSEISVAAGLLGIPALSVAIAPVVDWNSKTLKQLMQERVNNIRNMVNTGYFNPRPGSTGTGNTGNSGSSGNTGSSGSTEVGGLKPGTWVATYEGMNKQVLTPVGSTVTITDKGTITFTVMADSTVVGDGRGHFAYHMVGPDQHSDGETDYSFSVAGSAVGGDVYLGLASVPSPMTFPLVWTPKDGPQETSATVLAGPVLPQGALKLKSGGTLQSHQDNSAGGVQITETRSLTIN
jgi:hypothetical protein